MEKAEPAIAGITEQTPDRTSVVVVVYDELIPTASRLTPATDSARSALLRQKRVELGDRQPVLLHQLVRSLEAGVLRVLPSVTFPVARSTVPTVSLGRPALLTLPIGSHAHRYLTVSAALSNLKSVLQSESVNG